jgi:hypothetical protein
VTETEPPHIETAAALERLRVEMRFMRDELRELKDADKERTKASRALLFACVFSFLAPSLGVVWGYAQLTARVDQLVGSASDSSERFADHEDRLRSLEKGARE